MTTQKTGLIQFLSLHLFSTICLSGPGVINGTDIPIQLTEQDQQPDKKGATDSSRRTPEIADKQTRHGY